MCDTVAGLLAALLAAQAAGSNPQSATAERYRPRDPLSLVVPRRPVTRKDYVDLVRPLARGFESGPDRGTYGPRHALPALAVFALEGDPRLGEGIKKTLRHYGDWVKASAQKDKGVFSMEGGTLLAFYARELRRRGLMSPDDEAWLRDVLLTLRQYHYAWRPGDGLWRGSHHRSQCQGILHALAAAFYPKEPDAAKWKAYADKVWDDWWSFRDVGINDTSYFYSSFNDILRAAELLGRKEVFADPRSRKIFDRILFELAPDGGAIPYGPSGGYHSMAGARIFALELAARYTRDGRYRWGAHRIMNYGQARGFSNNHHHIQALSLEEIALASLVCDDSVAPVEPEPRSVLLWRPEIVRLTGRQARELFPDAGGVDCNMYMTRKEMPHKLVFRAGWNPGDLYMMVECYPRHDPLNPTAIIGMERWSASFAEMIPEKFVSRENAVAISDLSGSAAFLGRRGHKGEKSLPVGWAGMDASVPDFTDLSMASHARIAVTNYMGFDADHEREFLFVKNGWVLARDETTFRDSFRASVGPVWNTQHVGSPRGGHWMNTWFSAHYFQSARLYDVPPWDLLVWHAPKAGASLVVSEAPVNTPANSRIVHTRYAWEGDVRPGARLQFVQVYLPHAPVADATPLAQGIEVLLDRPGAAAVKVGHEGRIEVGILNPAGDRLELDAKGAGRIVTDARAAYMDFKGGSVRRLTVVQGTQLRCGSQAPFSSGRRGNFEKGGP